MADDSTIRLNKVLRELNISLDRAVDFLASKGHKIDARPTTKITEEVHQVLLDEFQTDMSKKVASIEVGEEKRKEKEAIRLQLEQEQEEKRLAREKRNAASEVVKAKAELSGPKMVGKIDLDGDKKAKAEEPAKAPAPEVEAEKEVPAPPKPVEKKKTEKAAEKKAPEPAKEEVPETIETKYQKLSGPKIMGDKIDLSKFEKPKKKKETAAKADPSDRKKRRKRIVSDNGSRGGGRGRFDDKRSRSGGGVKVEPTEEEVQKQVRETLEKLQGKSKKGKGAKYRRDKRDMHRQQSEKDLEQQELENKVLKVTEFVTVGEVATMMDVPSTQIISACMSLGIMVTMNQRLDAETLSIVADEFGYEVEFVTAEIEEAIEEEADAPEDLKPRAPIVTVMGHVDHGKTSLLDYIRKENVIAGESGGITQHIGAYGVELDSGQKITFLDTPGHEAFTAMRARGAQVTDIAIIVIAADDDIMPQTKEAISHAQAAGVPIVFAINKIDRPTANPEKIKEGLAGMNLLVEDWGGKIQSHDISAKTGAGVKELLEKVLLEAELLELKANPDKLASGTVVEAFLDKGRGYVSTVLVLGGTLKIGDYVLAGTCSGKIKAMQDERGKTVKVAGPATPISILGLDGAPQAGDKFNVLEDEREAKQIAAKRSQLLREQSVRTQRHITLDEIGRRIALGDFKELNIILKGDVDGSVEALTDSFQKLSTDEIQVNIIHKGVGAITESDVLLASASDAIVIGFNVRPMGNARDIADKEEIDIRIYSIIYDAINDLKDAMEGMLSPEIKEEITGTAEIRETFKISKIGTIAGCMVTSGKIFRNSNVRLIRDGVVIYTGELASLKRFKDDVKEVSKGYDCGLQIKNYNDIRENDIVEAFQEVAVKKTL
ncbi:bacterial translation initiation factor 2 (bIF-2) [Muriicola jejuensis]|uniref:Translation initiation factor IF-2 n=1 Tax=Muriicola jejuensis TaxID=504488 RepID=A0A6P0UE25_9FLAO|nr:translation initiation factor IF-2 [Muriicola jejuensis]NER09523.1 translation initiation factor IF-2 [Muriicola jejuensis]SMP08009.1 bacterial translation initiation factor 2 (bIF-2) [Muriicola jejuensis]